MRIGLLRHFPVTEPVPSGWMTAAELRAWKLRYDSAAVQPGDIAFDSTPWTRCYSSDLRRAYATAQALYSGEIVQTPLLREADFAPFQTGRLRLPVLVWRWILQLAWMTGQRTQRPLRDDFMRRLQAVADLATSAESDVLLVTHAGLMAYLRKELLRRGFRGSRFRIAKHARLYVFQRDSKAA